MLIDRWKLPAIVNTPHPAPVLGYAPIMSFKDLRLKPPLPPSLSVTPWLNDAIVTASRTMGLWIVKSRMCRPYLWRTRWSHSRPLFMSDFFVLFSSKWVHLLAAASPNCQKMLPQGSVASSMVCQRIGRGARFQWEETWTQVKRSCGLRKCDKSATSSGNVSEMFGHWQWTLLMQTVLKRSIALSKWTPGCKS